MSTADNARPYAWDVEIRHHDGSTKVVTVVAPTANQARRRAMLKPCAAEVLTMESMTEQQYRRVYGDRRIRP